MACGVYHSIFTVLEQMLLIVIVSSAVDTTCDRRHNQQHMTQEDLEEQYGAIAAAIMKLPLLACFFLWFGFNLIWSHGATVMYDDGPAAIP